MHSFDKKYKTLVVTSANPGEGKTTVSSNLALVLSQGEKKVLLIDCDMRRPSIHKRFKSTNKNGITDLLVGNKNIGSVINKFSNNLDVITSGSIPPNPAEMLDSKAMTMFIDSMKSEYDYIVIDTPPVQAVADAQILSTKADGVLFVVKAEETKKDVVMDSISKLKNVNANIIGTILNGMQNKNEKYYYSY